MVFYAVMAALEQLASPTAPQTRFLFQRFFFHAYRARQRWGASLTTLHKLEQLKLWRISGFTTWCFHNSYFTLPQAELWLLSLRRQTAQLTESLPFLALHQWFWSALFPLFCFRYLQWVEKVEKVTAKIWIHRPSLMFFFFFFFFFCQYIFYKDGQIANRS